MKTKPVRWCFSSWLETSSHQLASCSQSFGSFAADLGTEVILADFTAMDPARLLPTWIRNAVRELNGDNHVQATACQYLFENARGMPGIPHICANAKPCKDGSFNKMLSSRPLTSLFAIVRKGSNFLQLARLRRACTLTARPSVESTTNCTTSTGARFTRCALVCRCP